MIPNINFCTEEQAARLYELGLKGVQHPSNHFTGDIVIKRLWSLGELMEFLPPTIRHTTSYAGYTQEYDLLIHRDAFTSPSLDLWTIDYSHINSGGEVSDNVVHTTAKSITQAVTSTLIFLLENKLLTL